MSLHRLTRATLGVPDVAACADFYAEFGLVPTAADTFSTTVGGEQLRLESAARRVLVELGLGVDDERDLDELESRLVAHGAAPERAGADLVVVDAPSEVRIRIGVAERLPLAANGGAPARTNCRADAVDRTEPVRPRKLGHVVIGSPDPATTRSLFVDALGFAVSDEIAGIAAFMRCSTDHHNVLVQPAPRPTLHHTSWMVDDVDEVGRGGTAMTERDPERHLWGLGRHYIGSNWFWYLRDPAGNFAEYYADLDVITDPEAWHATAIADRRALYAWAPPVPDDFLAPPDLVEAG